MIRPYLAVIADSFHAALASRVLWVALFAIWLLLAGLAPVGYREDYTTTFRPRDFRNGTGMKATLAAALVVPEQRDTPAGRIAAALPEDLKRQLRRVGNDEEIRIRLSLFAEAMNELLEDEVWYSEEAWGRTMRYGELRRLEETPAGELSESLKRRRARLRIEAALPGAFRARSPRSITLTYAGFDFPADFAVDKTRFVDLVNQFVIPTMISWLLGFALVFLGILVTAPVVPDMLQPGSLHLLLSKPISRAALLLSKFLGGCAFVLLCVTQLVVGLWLIAGFRLDLWNPRLLWCIPVSVFLFSVFYSVSVVAALRWRSPILAVGVTCLFGALCLVVGLIGGLFDQFVTRPERIRSVTAAEDTFVGATFGGGLVRWDPASNRWIEVIESSATSGDRVFPPVRLGPRQVVTADAPRGRFNVYASGGLDLLVLDGASGWEPQPAIRLPTATTRLHRFGEQHLLAVNTSGIMITDRRTVLEQVTTSAAKPGREDDSERSTSSRADGASAAGDARAEPARRLAFQPGREAGRVDRPILTRPARSCVTGLAGSGRRRPGRRRDRVALPRPAAATPATRLRPHRHVAGCGGRGDRGGAVKSGRTRGERFDRARGAGGRASPLLPGRHPGAGRRGRSVAAVDPGAGRWASR